MDKEMVAVKPVHLHKPNICVTFNC